MQFRKLYREFLFRIVDLELLSSSALGDSSKLLGQFAALLIFVSLFLTVPALAVGSKMAPPLQLFTAWSGEHIQIATTMLVVGLFAVLSWDSTFPDRRDLMVLVPLPVRARTLFLAKVAAGATGLCLSVALLNGLPGLAWPLALGTQGGAPVRVPALEYLPAAAPVDAAGVERLLDRDLARELAPGIGVAIGVLKRGERRLIFYGTARPDSIYQIASISKTFTGLLLAQMVSESHVRLDQPLRELLPPGTVRRPAGPEITLLDLATHRSGLPGMPDNVGRTPESVALYTPADLHRFIAKRGVSRAAHPPAVYSNLGFSLLGQVLADRAGMTYSDLIAQRITGPWEMRDTAIDLSPVQAHRVIPAYTRTGGFLKPWDIGALAPAGGIYSTAGDMLAYLEHQLRDNSDSVLLSQKLQNTFGPGVGVALAWIYNQERATYWHNGAISAYTSQALFNRKEDYAAVVLVNQAIVQVPFFVADHIEQRLTGQPAISLASVTVQPGRGIAAVVQTLAAYWATMLLAGLFVYCCVLVLQGAAAQLLPRRLFLRVSSWLQLTAFCAIVSVYVLQPMVPAGRALPDAAGSGLLAWSPSYWFLGLFQQLSGSPALALFARRAWIAVATAIGCTALVYTLSYFRTLRRIAEEPDISPGARGGVWLPRFGGATATAIVHFSIHALLRSRLHRLVLAFYLGIGFAFMILLVRAPAAREQLDDAPVTDVWGQVNAPVLAASIAMLGFAILGTRVGFSIPLDLRANWIFRITGQRRPAECLHASRRALVVLSLAPVWLASAGLCFWLWPWRDAAGHLAILAGLGITLAEICLHGFQKIPFTCSYLPGKSQVHLAVLGSLGLLWSLAMSVRYERQVLEDPGRMASVLILLALLAAAARWRTQSAASSSEEEVYFEDAGDPAVQVLGLSRDGYTS
jgi:CubicO group peptidase (beta-lactamase class C family)